MNDIISPSRAVVNLSPHEIASMAAVANHLSRLGIGLHCARCEADLVGNNADTDKMFSVSCRCREFIASNMNRRPDPTSPFAD